MIASSPEQVVQRMDQAFNEGDIDAVLNFYDDSAVVVTEPGKLSRSKAELRTFFEAVAREGASAKQITTRVIESDGIALFLSRWSITEKSGNAHTFVATSVLRQQPNGQWRVLIDNAFGPLILDAG